MCVRLTVVFLPEKWRIALSHFVGRHASLGSVDANRGRLPKARECVEVRECSLNSTCSLAGRLNDYCLMKVVIGWWKGERVTLSVVEGLSSLLLSLLLSLSLILSTDRGERDGEHSTHSDERFRFFYFLSI